MWSERQLGLLPLKDLLVRGMWSCGVVLEIVRVFLAEGLSHYEIWSLTGSGLRERVRLSLAKGLRTSRYGLLRQRSWREFDRLPLHDSRTFRHNLFNFSSSCLFLLSVIFHCTSSLSF